MALVVKIKESVSCEAFFERLNNSARPEVCLNWSVDSDGDFTYGVAQWGRKAWFRVRPVLERENKIEFGIIASKKFTMSKGLYAVYHGRFAEMLLCCADDMIEEIHISSLLRKGIDYIPE